LHPDPVVEINRDAAIRRGIRTGQIVTVASPRGRIHAAAHLTDDLQPDVVVMMSGWSMASGADANCLTDDLAVDPVSGFPEFRALLCDVRVEN